MPADLAICITNETPVAFRFADVYAQNATWQPGADLSHVYILSRRWTIGRLTPTQAFENCSVSLALEAPLIGSRRPQGIEIGFGLQPFHGEGQCWVSAAAFGGRFRTVEWEEYVAHDNLYVAMVRILRAAVVRGSSAPAA